MARTRIVKDLSTKELVVVPYTAQEEAEADAVFAADELAQAPIRADEQRRTAIKSNSRRQVIMNFINTHTDAEIEAYALAASNTQAKASRLLADIALIIAGSLRD